MKKASNGFIKNLRYICLIGIIALALMTIVASGGGGGGDGGDTGDGGAPPENGGAAPGPAYPDTVVDTISVGNWPQDLAVTPDGSYVYVTNNNEFTVSVIQASDNTVVDTISVGDGPEGLAVTPDGSYIYVANFSDDTVSVIGFSE